MPVFENKEWTRLWYDEAADRETPARHADRRFGDGGLYAGGEQASGQSAARGFDCQLEGAGSSGLYGGD